jgi:hypothetical protein
MLVSLLFSCRDHDTLLCVGICDGKVLISISKVLSDAFCEGVEWVAEEDVVEGIWHDLHLKIDLNVVKGEADIAEVAMRFSVMFHIILTSETLLPNQCPLRYTAASISVTAADFVVNATAAVSVTATNFAINAAAAIYVASAVTAAFTVVAAAFTVVAAAFTVVAAAFTATTAVSVPSASASDRSPHSVNPVRPWSYHPLAPFPQSVTSI